MLPPLLQSMNGRHPTKPYHGGSANMKLNGGRMELGKIRRIRQGEQMKATAAAAAAAPALAPLNGTTTGVPFAAMMNGSTGTAGVPSAISSAMCRSNHGGAQTNAQAASVHAAKHSGTKLMARLNICVS